MREGGITYIRAGGSYALCKCGGGVIGSDSEETSSGNGEARRGLYSLVSFSCNLSSQGLLAFPAFESWAGAGCLRIGGGGFFQSLVCVEDGWSKRCQVILPGVKLVHFPRVGEGLAVKLRVAEHLLELGVTEGALDGGVEILARRGGGDWANGGGWEGAGGGGGRGPRD